ncbi:hypothetical protein K504DRAFT_493793 [Pleomassaria siparia CBS 279.74]|uniref:Uncharacterized protein n=1 Tax=Pleomassaria siparia CBS 279.74 TaxID=1314801 RepID=A0A6G1K0N4_9PLEO|nr:hypothetical protein K504DRAFT_493793 [Pleomassaria siparia CBS 279.74]
MNPLVFLFVITAVGLAHTSCLCSNSGVALDSCKDKHYKQSFATLHRQDWAQNGDQDMGIVNINVNVYDRTDAPIQDILDDLLPPPLIHSHSPQHMRTGGKPYVVTKTEVATVTVTLDERDKGFLVNREPYVVTKTIRLMVPVVPKAEVATVTVTLDEREKGFLVNREPEQTSPKLLFPESHSPENIVCYEVSPKTKTYQLVTLLYRFWVTCAKRDEKKVAEKMEKISVISSMID